jgi:hypothetical protein
MYKSLFGRHRKSRDSNSFFLVYFLSLSCKKRGNRYSFDSLSLFIWDEYSFLLMYPWLLCNKSITIHEMKRPDASTRNKNKSKRERENVLQVAKDKWEKRRKSCVDPLTSLAFSLFLFQNVIGYERREEEDQRKEMFFQKTRDNKRMIDRKSNTFLPSNVSSSR